MKVTFKLISAVALWLAVVTVSVVYTVTDAHVLLVWGVVTTAAAAVSSSVVVAFCIADKKADYIIEQIKSERRTTIAAAADAMKEADRRRADQVVSRVQEANAAALRRVAGEIAEAMQGDRATPFRR